MEKEKSNPFGWLDDIGDKSFHESVSSQALWADPCKWVEDKLGLSLFSNQIDIIEAIRNPDLEGFNVLGCRGSGKTEGVSYGFNEICTNRPGTQIIVAAPIEKQAGRILRRMKASMQASESLVKDVVDWPSASALRIPYKNGSSVVAISGQEKSNSEGEHGNILAIDEAHLVPSYSVTNKLIPMVGMVGGYSKIIKMGVSMGHGHFYKSVMAPKAKNLICRWDQAEIYLMEPRPFFYRGRQYSKKLISRMPLPLRIKLFPDLPDLHIPTGYEITEIDWATQYNMDWVDDINNLLSDDDQERLAAGKHKYLIGGRSGDLYFAGLDTAYSERRDSDRTVLAIWRLRKDGQCERVASFVWHGQVLTQKREIMDIVHPKKGMFKCEAVFADYSNIAIDIVNEFRTVGVPISGVTFGSSAKLAGSNKNWKNTMYDHFLIRLQNEEVVYPGIKEMKEKIITDSDERVQVDNMLEGFWQWCIIQRTRTRSLNDKIEAPKDTVEDEDEGESVIAHDDHCSADILAVWAARHRDMMRKLMTMSPGAITEMDIPAPVLGYTMATPFGREGLTSPNPYAPRLPVGPNAPTKSDPRYANDQGTQISDWIGVNSKQD